MPPSYLRFPHLRADLVTFTADDDVWLAPVTGGRAWRVSHDSVPVSKPRLSPDGDRLAWVSTVDGHPEVHLADVDGSRRRRLTWWGAKRTTVLGWHGDGDEPRVLVASEVGQANLRHTVVRSVGLDHSVQTMPWGPASGVALRPDGAVALSTPVSRPPAWWKRYRGGTASRLWLDADGSGEWRQLLPGEPAALVDPLWVGGELCFVSDRADDGRPHQANLWRWPEPGIGEPELLTRQGVEQGYVRDASTDGARVVWHSRGTVQLLDALDASPRTLEVSLPGRGPVPFAAPPTEQLDLLQPDHTGDASLVGWRGGAYRLGHTDGPLRACSAEPGVRVREPVLLGRTGDAAVVSDRHGEDCLQVVSLDGSTEPRDLCVGQLGRVLHLAADPAGDRLATISSDGRVGLVEVGEGSWRLLTTSEQGEARSPSFSPDGRYLLWSQPTVGEAELHQLVVVDLQDGETVQPLTSGRFHDHSPAFSADGRYLLFLSTRTFDPSYDTHAFGLSFTGSTRPWLLPLAATDPAPFGPNVDGWPTRPGADHQTEAPDVRCPDLDATDPEQRVLPLPVPAGDLHDLRTTADGVLWIRRSGESGTLGSRRAGVGGDPAPDLLEHWSFHRRRHQTLCEDVKVYAVSGDGARVLVRTRKDEVSIRPAGRPVESDDPELVPVDLDRLQRQVDPAAEWQQMFDENARLMRDHFWRADMGGVDWDAVVARWRPLVSVISTADDLVDLLWETVGELNTSHAYVMPAPPADDQDRRLGLLGADLSPAAGGWRIDRVLPGESSDPDARSPLLAAGVDAHVGDRVTHVAGVPVDPSIGPASLLVGAADRPVELTLARDGRPRRVVVVPLADEETLRYQDWVRSRREHVLERSGGRLGYLHLPDMMSPGWAQLHRDLRHASSADGLVVDVRYNRGGHTSQLVVARLAARVVGWSSARHHRRPMSYPLSAPRGPVVLVANEFSGSDGDIVNAAARALGIGSIVGRRTWGGVIGIDSRFHLVDGTVVTQPRYAFWLDGQGWGVENHGVDPDIEVVHSPADFSAGRDLQLDRAVDEALARLVEQPPATPPSLPAPRWSE